METRGNLEKLSEGKVHILTRSATYMDLFEGAKMYYTCFSRKRGLIQVKLLDYPYQQGRAGADL